MKDRVTLTLDKNLLRRIDASVDGKHIKNRSHAIEMLLYTSLEGNLPQEAVVICGGSATLLEKMLTPRDDGKSILQHNVFHLAESGIPEIIIVTGDVMKVKEHVGDGTDLDVSIRYIAETTPLGNAGALNLARPYTSGPVIVTYGSAYKDVSIKDMYEFHKSHGSLCTIALTTTTHPGDYGVALLNGTRIITFVEKPRVERAPSNLISSGFFIIEQDVLDLIPQGYAKMEFDVFPILAKQDTLYGYNFPGEYEDIR